jgi:hypothetical protein
MAKKVDIGLKNVAIRHVVSKISDACCGPTPAPQHTDIFFNFLPTMPKTNYARQQNIHLGRRGICSGRE